MSRMSDLHLSITQDLEAGLLTFQEIAAKYEVPVFWVDDTATELWADDLAASDGSFNSAVGADYDDSMDGDFDSAMTSAGHGTDEDYGYYGDGDAG